LAGDDPYGKYLLLTIGKNGILDVRPFDTDLKGPIVIKLHEKEDGSKEQH
jgi:hypothetical protein